MDNKKQFNQTDEQYRNYLKASAEEHIDNDNYYDALICYYIISDLDKLNINLPYYQSAINYYNIARAYRGMQEPEQAVIFCKKAIQLLKKQTSENICLISKLYNFIAEIYNEQCNYYYALEYFYNIVKINLTSQNNHIIASAYNNIALIHQENGNYFDALQYYCLSLASLLMEEHYFQFNLYNIITNILSIIELILESEE